MPLFGRKKPEPPAVVEPADPPTLISEGIYLKSDGSITLSIESVDQAKIGIKALKLEKKELNARKKQIGMEIKALRVQRSEKVAAQGSMVRGGGNIGKYARAMQRAGRDNDRRQHASALAPHEREKMVIDMFITNIDQAIVHLERYILQQST